MPMSGESSVHEAWALDDLIWLCVGVFGFTLYRLDFPTLVSLALATGYGMFLRLVMTATIRDAVKGFITLIANTFFREISSEGEERIPKRGPLIFVVAPHSNQFLDPAIVVRQSPRSDLGFVIAAKSIKRSLIGPLARGMESIPVIRQQDQASARPGMVRPSEDDPCLLEGRGTAFPKHVKVGGSVYVGKTSATIAAVESDTVLRLKAPLGGETDKTPPGTWTPYKFADRVDHSVMFHEVWNRLRSGKCVGIFPEGGSHDRPSLLPLKAGVAIMALGAMAEYPGLNVRIVPCGLTYFNGHRFRSRAYVAFGQPLTISPTLVDKFRMGGSAKRDACTGLLGNIQEALSSTVVQSTDHDTLKLIWAVRRLYNPSSMRLQTTDKLRITKHFLTGYERMKDNPRLQQLTARVSEYNAELEANGLKDYQVDRIDVNTSRALCRLSLRLLKLIAIGTFGIPGLLLNLPVLVTARVVSSRKQREALKGSSVKIEAKDVLASWKVLIAMVLVPLMYVSGLVLAAVVASFMGWYISHAVVYFGIAMPLLCYVSIRVVEIEHHVWRSIVPLAHSVYHRNRTEALREKRRMLKEEIVSMVDEMGPLVFPDTWEKERVIKPEVREEAATAVTDALSLEAARKRAGVQADDGSPRDQ